MSSLSEKQNLAIILASNPGRNRTKGHATEKHLRSLGASGNELSPREERPLMPTHGFGTLFVPTHVGLKPVLQRLSQVTREDSYWIVSGAGRMSCEPGREESHLGK